MNKKSLQLGVIEGKWKKDTNLSVKNLFDLLSDIHHNTPHGYAYEMFCNASSLKDIISRMGKTRNLKYIYIGAHGNDDCIAAAGENIRRTAIRNELKQLSSGAIEGLFFGSCLFGNEDNASFLLGSDEKTPIKWVAGYTTAVDWMESSALDILFWSTFYGMAGTPIKRIEDTTEHVSQMANGLIKKLGFQIYVRKKGKTAGLKNLLAEVHDDK